MRRTLVGIDEVWCLNYVLDRDNGAVIGRQLEVKSDIVVVLVPSVCGNTSYQDSHFNVVTIARLRIPPIPAGNLAFPDHRHLKSSSPQMPVPDNETIACIFPGEVIIVDHGKIVRHGAWC